MEDRSPSHRPSIAPGLLHPPRPDHMPPRMLSDDELAESRGSLHAKLSSARRSLVLAYSAGALLSLGLVAAGLVLLWFGPQVFLDRILGVRQTNSITTMALWWIVVVAVAVVGGAMGVQVLSGKLRYARHWKHRVEELALRLRDVETEHHRRAASAEERR
jgi:hypothetical protein